MMKIYIEMKRNGGILSETSSYPESPTKIILMVQKRGRGFLSSTIRINATICIRLTRMKDRELALRVNSHVFILTRISHSG